METKFYAVYKPYGTQSLNTFEGGDGGNRSDHVCEYRTAELRDAAVESDPEHMMPVASSDKHLRRYLASDQYRIDQEFNANNWECSTCGRFAPNSVKRCPDCALDAFDEESE
jgi:hypothetical protein